MHKCHRSLAGTDKTGDCFIQRAILAQRETRTPTSARGAAWRLPVCGLLLLILTVLSQAQQTAAPATPAPSPTSTALTAQTASIIERESVRLRSESVEERIDAALRLGALSRPDASRAAATALNDSSPRVRATAVKALRALPATETSGLLLGLLNDRDEFVRQQTAYTLGETNTGAISETVVTALLTKLETDKSAGVRGAAAVALGQIGDKRAVADLIETLSRKQRAGGFLNRVRRRRVNENEFVRRSVARSLGMIGDRSAVPVLIEVVGDERTETDVRREAARALGTLGDPQAIPALRGLEKSPDALLSRIAFESLAQLDAATSN
jgi:HEAT repeat protein